MESFWLLTLGILFDISIEIPKVSAWDPKIRRYEGYDLGRGPVFYEAYYRDEQTGNDNPENNVYPDKRYFDHETVVERSYQVPADTYGPVSGPDRTRKLTVENYNDQGSTYLPASIGNERIDEIASAPRGYYIQGHRQSQIHPREERTLNTYPVQDYVYETRPKIYVPEDRFIFGEPILDDPGDPGPYNFKPTKLNPDTEENRNPAGRAIIRNTVITTGTNEEDPRLQTRSLPERSPEARVPESLENIYEPRPQVINYVFSMPKRRYQPMASAGNEPAESTLEAEANEWPRNYGDNLINDDIRREDERELRKDEVAGVESIEVSQVPRHKIRHHHGEWPKRNYSRLH